MAPISGRLPAPCFFFYICVMTEDFDNYGLDLHCCMILDEYRTALPVFRKIREVVTVALGKAIDDNGIYVTALESRIKQEASLAGKLELKGSKYGSLSDITDIFGARVITFYADEVDKIAALADKIFDVDWANSIDKRKMHELSSFGYNSLHYVCRIPKSLYEDPEMPQINEFRFELQMRTALQHVWANMYHDTGYKSGVEVPSDYLRNLNRLAGMLELADEQFSSIRTNINNYRRLVHQLVSSGRFDEVPLDGDTFGSYLKLKPFDKLNKRIAAINQAEIHPSSSMHYIKALKALGFKTLGDVETLVKDYSDDAYILACFEIGNTDIDIISETVAIQDLLVVHILENGGGRRGLIFLFDTLDGPSDYNEARADRIMAMAAQLPFMNNKYNGK